MSLASLFTALIEGFSLAVEQVPDETVKKKLREHIEKLKDYVKELEGGIINRDQVIKELKHEIEQLRNLLKNKGEL